MNINHLSVYPAEMKRISHKPSPLLTMSEAELQQLIDKVAREFSARLHQEIGTDILTVILRNQNAVEGVCHSHDFCDANEVMNDAFRAVMGREMSLPSDDSFTEEEKDADSALWIDAWTLASSRNFAP